MLAPKGSEYFRRLADVADVYAVVEIADTSLKKDIGIKRALYARFGIAEYFVVDVNDCVVLHYVEPHDIGYDREEHVSYGQAFELGAVPGVVLEANRFLPPR